MNIKEMNIDQVEARYAELRQMDVETIENPDEILNELNDLESRKAELIAIAESRAEIRGKIADGAITGTTIENPLKEGRKEMANEIELRNTLEYGKAFIKAVIHGDDTELRALLSANAEGGSVPIPEALDNEIRNAWEETQFLSLAKNTSYKGNVKVGFEYSATGAVVHVEGAEAPAEETLVWGSVELKAQTIKKWITISDEAIENTTIDTLKEIYAELAQRIAEKAEEVAIALIVASPATSTATAPAVPVYTAATIAEDTIVNALGLLSGKAKNVYLVMNRQTKAAFKGVAMKAKYAVDIFDGLSDRIVYTDALPAFSAASSGNTYVIAGDIGYGLQANKPNGNDIKIVVDELSLSEKDLVKVVGKMLVGLGVVAPKAFVKIVK